MKPSAKPAAMVLLLKRISVHQYRRACCYFNAVKIQLRHSKDTEMLWQNIGLHLGHRKKTELFEISVYC